MATIGWVKVGFAADTSQIKKAAQEAAESIKSFQETLTHLAEAYVGFEAIKGFGEKIKETMEGITETKHLAERVGMTAEAFSKLGYAANLAHIDTETLATSLGQMSRRLGEVAMTGAGPVTKVLKRFGLSVEDLSKMGAEEAFMKIADIMAKIQSPMERSAVAVDLFGKAGQPMINLMAEGSEGLKKAGDEAVRFGVALDNVNVEKVAEAEVQTKRLDAAFQGVWNTLAVNVAPFLTAGLEQIINWGTEGKRSTSFIAQGVDMITTAFGSLIDALNVFKTGWYSLEAVIAEGEANILEGFNKLGDWMRSFHGKGGWLGFAPGARSEAMDAFGDSLRQQATDAAKEALKAFDQVGKGTKTAREFVDEIKAEADKKGKEAAAAAAKFIAPGAIMPTKPDMPKFAGAVELGSKEAYSSILEAQERLTMNKQDQVVQNTKETADAGKTSVLVLQAIAKTLQEGGGVNAANNVLPLHKA